MIFEEKTSLDDIYRVLWFDDIITLSHCQRSFELLFVTEGLVLAERQSSSMEVPAGSCLWVLPYEVHRYSTPTHSRACVVIFAAEVLPDFGEAMYGLALTDPLVPFTAEELTAFSTAERIGFGLKSRLYHQCELLLRQGTKRRAVEVQSDPMTRIMLYLQSHADTRVTLAQLAEHMGYSYHYTSALFRRMFGMGFAEYVNAMRLEAAARSLRNSSQDITRICMDHGFANMRTFDHAFTGYFGLSPSAYRRKMKNTDST